MKKKKPTKPLNSYARLSGIAFQMMSIIAIGTYLGVKLDEKFPNEHKLYTLFLSLGSVILSLIYVIRRIIKDSKEN